MFIIGPFQFPILEIAGSYNYIYIHIVYTLIIAHLRLILHVECVVLLENGIDVIAVGIVLEVQLKVAAPEDVTLIAVLVVY